MPCLKLLMCINQCTHYGLLTLAKISVSPLVLQNCVRAQCVEQNPSPACAGETATLLWFSESWFDGFLATYQALQNNVIYCHPNFSE